MDKNHNGEGRPSRSGLRHRSTSTKLSASTCTDHSIMRSSLMKAKEMVESTIAKISEKPIDPEKEPGFFERNPFWEAPLPSIHHDEVVLTHSIVYDNHSNILGVLPTPQRDMPHLSNSFIHAQNKWRNAYLKVKKDLVFRNQALKSAVGTGAEVAGLSFGVWDRYSPSRARLFHILYNQTTEYFVFALILLHVIVIIMRASMRVVGLPPSTQVNIPKVIDENMLYIFDAVLTGIFSVECIARIACLGLWRGPKAYLRNMYNMIDLISVLDSIAQLVAERCAKRYNFFRFLTLRLFRALLALRRIDFFTQVLGIFDALHQSMEPLQDVLLLALVLLFFYALIGLQFFGSDLNYRCVRKQDLKISYPVVFCSHFNDRGFVCPSNQVCMKLGGNPGFELQKFDMFPFAFLTLFQVITLEGWSFVMYVMKDVEFSTSVVYFVTLIVIVTYLLINIVVAAISGVFLRVRHEHQALLKKNRDEKKFNIYNATVIASILKDALKQENKKVTCHDLFNRKAEEVKAKIDETLKKTNIAIKKITATSRSSIDASHSQTIQGVNDNFDWDPEGRTQLSREFSNSRKDGVAHALTRWAKTYGERVKTNCKAILASKYFKYIELSTIAANMMVLCLYYDGMSYKLLYTIYALESVFLIIFTSQMVVRFLVGGLSRFINDKINVFDTLVIAISAGSIMSRTYPNISAARMLRFFYVGNKERANQKINVVGECLDGLRSMGAVAFFYILIIFIFSVISMELYVGKYVFEEGYARNNFDTIFRSMFTWFMVTTADNWMVQMWNSARPGIPNRWIGPCLFVLYFVITVYLMLNLVIAVILENTELSDEKKKSIQKDMYLKHLRARHSYLLKSRGKGTWLIAFVEKTSKKLKSVSMHFNTKKIKSISILADTHEVERGLVSKIDHQGQVNGVRFPGGTTNAIDGIVSSNNGLKITMDTSQNLHSQPSPRTLQSMRIFKTSNRLSNRANQILLGSGFTTSLSTQQPNTALRNSVLALLKPHVSFKPETSSETLREATSEAEANNMSFSLQDYEALTSTFTYKDEYPWYLSDDALYVFSLENPIRIACQRIVENIIFRCYMVGVVIVSVAILMCINQNYILPKYLVYLNIFVFVAFLIEFILKVIAYGFLFTPDSYLGDPYNFLDLFLLVIDGLNVIPSWNPTQFMIVRIVDSLRPLRILCHIPGMRVVSSNLLRTIPAVFSMFLFTLATYSVFAVIGVQMFKGRFSKCSSSTSQGHKIDCVKYNQFSTSILRPSIWDRPQYHFDDFPTALLSLFIISTFDDVQEGFVHPVMDIKGPLGTQPMENYSPNNSLFFIVFICIGGFFILRMFVGVFIDQFGLISGSKLLTERQKLLRDTNRIIQNMKPLRKPRKPLFRFQKYFHSIVTSSKYGPTIRFIVLLNYTWLATHFAGQPHWLTRARNIVEASFASFYCLDVLVKIIGLDVRDFIKSPWNLFELGIAIFSETMIMPETLSIRKTLGRIPMGARIFRVIRYTPKLHTLLEIVVTSMRHMLDIVFLLVILLITFSGVGVQYFGNIRDGKCVGYNVNFSTFGTSFITLFQVLTSDNWSCVMADAQTEFPYCTTNHPKHGDDCGGSAFALLYFLIFIIVATNVFMNMFVAIIIDTITFGLLKEKTIITPENLKEYRVLWQDPEFDPRSTGYIHLHKLRSFLDRLDVPLGRRHNAPIQWYVRIEWEALSFHVAGKGIPFRELLETLALYKIGSRGLELALRIEREKQVQIIYKNGAASKIQAAIRGFLVRSEMSKQYIDASLCGAEELITVTKTTNVMLFD